MSESSLPDRLVPAIRKAFKGDPEFGLFARRCVRRPCASGEATQLHLAGPFPGDLICPRGSESAHPSTYQIRRRFTRRGPRSTQTIRRMLPTRPSRELVISACWSLRTSVLGLWDGLAHYCSERCHFFRTAKRWRRGSESNRRIKVLQTSPLPLGYRAILNIVPPGRMEPQPGICDFPITPARFACKNRDFHHAACAATTFRLNPSGNPATQAARKVAIWSGRRDLNPRPSPWQGDALPLSYSRIRPQAVYRAAPRPVNATPYSVPAR